MLFSEDIHYRAYGAHIAARDYPAARSDLQACMLNPSIVPTQIAMLLQIIGKTYFFEQNIEQALHYYEMGEQAGVGTLRPYLSTAQFLAEWMKDYERTIAKCDEIIRLATSSPSEKTEDDHGSVYYIAKAEELKQFCYAQKAGK